MHDETVELDERSIIEEQIEPFAGGKLSFRVLRLEAVGTAAELRFRDATLELLELFAHGHRPEIGKGKAGERCSPASEFTHHRSPITSHRHKLSIGGISSGTNPSSCVSSIGSTTGGVSGRGG